MSDTPAAPNPPAAPDPPAARSRGWAALWPDWVTHNMRIVLEARLAMSVSRAVAGVVTALYLAAEGFSGLELGLLFLCVTVLSAAFSTGIGVVSDRVGRKRFLVAVPFLTAVAALVFAFTGAAPVLFVFASLGSLGRGQGAGANNVGPYQPAESALVAEVVPSDSRAAAFGRLAFVSSLGALVGGLLAGLASAGPHVTGAAATSAYRPAFLAAALFAAVAGILALGINEASGSRVPDPSRRADATDGSEPGAGSRPGIDHRAGHFRWPRNSWPVLWRFWLTNGTNGLAIGMIGPFVSYWLFRRYGATPGTIGLLFALVNAGSLVSTLVAAGIARRLGTVKVISAVRALTGVLLVPMALAPTFWAAGAVFFVRMLIQRVGLPLRQSFTQDMADPEERASLAALSNLPAQGTMAGSQVLAGYLFDEVSLAAPFELAAVVQCVNAALYPILFAWRPPRRAATSTSRPPPEH